MDGGERHFGLLHKTTNKKMQRLTKQTLQIKKYNKILHSFKQKIGLISRFLQHCLLT